MIYNRKGLYDELAMIAEMDQAETGLQVNTCNKHVDIKFSAHDAFLQSPSASTLKAKIFEGQII
jgi:hypothetical protein